MTDSELVIFLHDMARKENAEKNLRAAQNLRIAADRLAELTREEK
jgi:hypothetical protein